MEATRPGDNMRLLVSLSEGFWIGKFEVTISQYQQIMGEVPSLGTGINNGPSYKPVAGVSWEKAMEFCKRLTSWEMSQGRLPAHCMFRLPTEAEWEYACQWSQSADLAETPLAMREWYAENSGSNTHPVGTKPVNAMGIADMGGNLAEWCLDLLPSNSSGKFTNIVGLVDGNLHVLRGGSWRAQQDACNCGWRHVLNSRPRIIVAGFRVVLVNTAPRENEGS
jgi:formylglycine-generating enzyme required for sulfatase activity